jgi:hypothetical protein
MVAAELPRTRRGWQETTAIVLLLVGGFMFGVGWLVGVILLWLSDIWTWRDKLLGTLVVPGGLVLPLLLLTGGIGSSTSTTVTMCSGVVGGTQHCTTSGGASILHTVFWIAVFVLSIVGPIAVAVHLARRSRVPA